MFVPDSSQQPVHTGPHKFAHIICGIIGGIIWVVLADKNGWKADSAGKWLSYVCPFLTMATSIVFPWLYRKLYARYLRYCISSHNDKVVFYISQAAGRPVISGDHQKYLSAKQFNADKTLIEFYLSRRDSAIDKYRRLFSDAGDASKDE